MNIVSSEQLTLLERTRLTDCELVIERGLNTFVDVGNALLEIRDSRLYRADYSTFEEYCRSKWGFTDERARLLMRSTEVVNRLTPTIVGVLPTNEAQARPLTRLEPEQQREAWTRAVETAPEGKITAAHVQSVVDEIQQKPHVANNSGNNEWYTPSEYIEAASAVMGEIDLDPASSELANATVKAAKFYTIENDGLTHSWRGRVWMNPPYSGDLVGKFVNKIIKHYAAGDIWEAIVLVNNATETAWFQTLLENTSAVCFVRRRIRYNDANGNPANSPLQGQAIVYLGNKQEKFANKYKEFGSILYG